MEPVKIKGTVKRVLEQSGTTSAGKTWTKKTLVIDNGSQYSNLAPVVFFGDKSQAVTAKEGDNVEVSLYVGGREYNGKYYPDLQGDSVTVSGGAVSTPASQPVAQPVGEDLDQLPF